MEIKTLYLDTLLRFTVCPIDLFYIKFSFVLSFIQWQYDDQKNLKLIYTKDVMNFVKKYLFQCFCRLILYMIFSVPVD